MKSTTTAVMRRAATKLGSRLRPTCAARVQASYHTTAIENSQQSPAARRGASSVDVLDYGYRFVDQQPPQVQQYAGTAQREDYDDYSLHCSGLSEGAQWDLANTTVGGDAVLQFDEAGFVKPIWETLGKDETLESAEDKKKKP